MLEKDIGKAIHSSPTGWTGDRENHDNENEWCDIQVCKKEPEKISVGTNTDEIQQIITPQQFDSFTHDVDSRFRENRTREIFSEVERNSNIFSMFDVSVFTILAMSIYTFIKGKN
jgi:hypothetical protein